MKIKISDFKDSDKQEIEKYLAEMQKSFSADSFKAVMKSSIKWRLVGRFFPVNFDLMGFAFDWEFDKLNNFYLINAILPYETLISDGFLKSMKKQFLKLNF